MALAEIEQVRKAMDAFMQRRRPPPVSLALASEPSKLSTG